jgi:hypothetical protein
MLGWVGLGFGDRTMLPKRPPAGAAQEDEPVPWLHVVLVGWAQFAGWMGFVAVEGSLSYIVVDAFGLSHQEVFYAWVPSSAMMLLGTLTFASLHRRKWKALPVLGVAGGAMAASMLALGAVVLPPPVPAAERTAGQLACLVLGVGAMLLAFAMTNTLFNGMLVQQLAPHQQSKYQTPVQSLAAVGRGVGPWAGTMLYALGDATSTVRARPPRERAPRRAAGAPPAGSSPDRRAASHPARARAVAQGLGLRLLLLFSFGSVALSIGVPWCFGSPFYDPPRIKPSLL